MNVEYYPAVPLPGMSGIFKGRQVNFTREDPIYAYDKLLVSYHYGKNVKKSDIGSHITEILGDSGGFQAINLDVDINPINVINWHNDICDLGFTLDVPPVEIGEMIKGTYLHGTKFYKCMNKSNENANIMMSRKSEDLKLYLVLQGYDTKTRKMWLDQGTKEYSDWDGYSLGAKPQGNPYQLIDWLFFAIENNLRDIHILGASGMLTMGILTYFGDKFDSIKFDSSSFSVGSQYRKYFVPDQLSQSITLGTSGILPNTLPCNCSICQLIDDVSIFNKDDYSTSTLGWLISMHNIYTTIEYLRKMKSVSYNESLLVSVLPKMKKLLTYIKRYEKRSTLAHWI